MFIITKLCYYYGNSIHTNISNNALKEYVPISSHKYYKVRPASQLVHNNYIFYSILCIGFVAVVISIKSGEHYHLSSNTSSIVLLSDSQEFHVALFPSSIQGAITCVSYCSLCFICHFNLFAIERELYRPKRWKMNFIIVTSMVTAYLIYNVVGFAGYIQVRLYPPLRYIYLSINLSILPLLNPSIYLSIYLYIYLSIYPSIYTVWWYY